MCDERILIVADESVAALGIQVCLNRMGFRDIDLATTGQEAVRKATEHPPDLVLMDVELPGDFNGIEAAQRIRRMSPTSLVYVTAGTDDETLERLLETEPDVHLVKPFRDQELWATIMAVLHRSLRSAPEVVAGADQVETAPDAIVVTDPEGRMILVNAQVEQMFGYRREELLGQFIEMLLPERFRQAHVEQRQHYAATMLTRPMATGSDRYGRRKDGTEFPVDLAFGPLRTPLGMFVTSIIRDFTVRKQAHDTLRDLLEAVPDALVVTDHHGRIVLVNTKTEQQFGWNRQDLLGEPVETLIPQRHRQAHVGYRNGCFGEPGLRAMESGLQIVALRRNGSEFPADISLNLLRRDDGPFVIAAVRDITLRKQAEDALRVAEADYRGIFENASVGIFRASPEGRCLKVNSAMARMLGYDSPERITQTITEIGRQICADPAQYRELTATLLTRRSVQGFECQFVCRDGSTIWVSLTARVVDDPNSPGCYIEGFVEDISNRKLLEEQLRQAQKMEGFGLLAGGIAHDFNNLLTVINGYGELALGMLPADSQARDPLQAILRAGQRASSLIRQLLAFSRRQILKPHLLNLSSLVGEMADMVRRVIREDINLITDLEPSLGQVMADTGQMEQVILNLVINARDAMQRGGDLILRTRNLELSERDARRHPDAAPGPYVLLMIQDTGHGMDEQTRARLFEPFFTTKEVGKGSGLGLAVVYGVVKQCRGFIEVQSQPGQGAAFVICLPRAETAAAMGQGDVASEETHNPKGTETILLVEDDDSVRDLTRQILRSSGYTVVESRNGQEALSLYGDRQAGIDLLMTDVVMPRMSGRELADLLTSVNPDLKVLFLSGYTDDAIPRHGVLATGRAFLQKPFSSADLTQVAHLDAPTLSGAGEFARRGRYFPLQEAVGTQAFGKLQSQGGEDTLLLGLRSCHATQSQLLAFSRRH